MEAALSFNSFSVSQNKLSRTWSSVLLKKKLHSSSPQVYCQGGGNVVKKSTSISSALTERSALMETGSLVLPQNGKTSQEENISVDLLSYPGQSHSLVEMDDGIGIVKFLRGKNFFITGATGFLAKVLVEKILRTAPDVGKIYLLIKAKDNEAAMARLTSEVTNSELFKCLRQTYGKSYEAFMRNKLVPVAGDVCNPNLVLEENLIHQIAKEVDIIVNSAANTSFDERYDVAIDINTKGASNLMTFAKRCKKLKLFLQVSTAYVNGQRQGKILEKPFSQGDSIAGENLRAENPTMTFPKLDVQSEINLTLNSNKGSEDSAATRKMKELGLNRAKQFGWQDTYVFTKAMGEMVIDEMRGDIPVVIIRPSIIESTWKEPFPGWMEGNRMMDPIVLSYGKGHLTGFPVDPNGVLDVVPADVVVNATLAAMARHGIAAKPDINVYQIASSVVNPLFFQDLSTMIYEYYCSSPCMDSKDQPIPVGSLKMFSSIEEFSAYLCGDANEGAGRLRAMMASSNGMSSRRLEVIYKKAVQQAKYLANIYEPYTFYRGRFDNSNTERLMETMSEEEKRSFGFDIQSIDWKDYITNVHVPGLRRHVMKERRH